MLAWQVAAAPTDMPSSPPAVTQRIEIVRTHSPRFPGFTVSIDDSGEASVLDESGKRVRHKHLPGSMTSMLFTSMQMAEPGIASMHAKPCKLEAASGGQIFLRLNETSSPDLSCNSSAMLTMVWGLAKQVMSMLGVNNYLGGLGSLSGINTASTPAP